LFFHADHHQIVFICHIQSYLVENWPRKWSIHDLENTVEVQFGKYTRSGFGLYTVSNRPRWIWEMH
jgi:hypothetical protein